MARQAVTRTYTVSITNQQRVSDDLDSLGFAASKLWNVGRWVCDRVWSEIGYIPGHSELTAYLKSHERYDDLHSQSSQRVLQELAEAFNGWHGKRRNGDARANPLGTANTTTITREARCRSKPLASNSTPGTTASDSARGRT